ncbi:MAG: 6-bladed beta-propeller [Prolixibacteraceae bacterium]|jgi:hypothetical protein|nr:6-bladed beta-propeller [Prolixibacteraceae bacterium]
MKNKLTLFNYIQFVGILFLFYCFTGLISCKTEQKNYDTLTCNIKTENDNLNVKVRSVIKLETSDSSLIGDITKIIFYKNRFFILDRMISKSLFVFDINGKFIAKTRRGRGPGECVNPKDFMIDPVNLTIQLWDQSNYNMMELDSNLTHVRTKHFEPVGLMNAEYINRDTMLVFAHVQVSDKTKNNNNLIYFNYSLYTNGFNKAINRLLPTSKELIRVVLESPICKTRRVIFVAPFDNNIYGIEKTKEKILYQLDFGTFGVNQADIAKGVNYIFKSSRNGSKITSIDNLHENDNYLAFSFFYKNRIGFFIHSKITNENYCSEKFFSKKILPICTLKGIFCEDNFIAVSEPEEVKNFKFADTKFNTQIRNIKEQDNPFIILFSLKEQQ